MLFKNICFAGAWTLPKDKFFFIAELEYKKLYNFYQTSEYKYNRKYNAIIHNYFSSLFTSLTIEKGLRDNLTVGISPKFVSNIKYDYIIKSSPIIKQKIEKSLILNNPQQRDSFYSGKIYYRKEIWKNNNSVLSYEPSFEYNHLMNYKILELRGLYGTNFKFLGMNNFLNVEIAFANNISKNHNTIKIDSTLGVKRKNDNLLLLQLFTTFEDKFKYKPTLKIQISNVYKLSDKYLFQIGGYSSIDKNHNYISQGLITSLWIRF